VCFSGSRTSNGWYTSPDIEAKKEIVAKMEIPIGKPNKGLHPTDAGATVSADGQGLPLARGGNKMRAPVIAGGVTVLFLAGLVITGCVGPSTKSAVSDSSSAGGTDILGAAAQVFASGKRYFIWQGTNSHYSFSAFGDVPNDVLVIDAVHVLAADRNVPPRQGIRLLYEFKSLAKETGKSYTNAGMAALSDHTASASPDTSGGGTDTYKATVKGEGIFELSLMGFGGLSGKGTVTIYVVNAKGGIEDSTPISNLLRIPVAVGESARQR
jgi:hypothetical protein